MSSERPVSAEPNPPPAYQWYSDDGSGFHPLAGANAPRYSVVPTNVADGALLRCEISVPQSWT